MTYSTSEIEQATAALRAAPEDPDALADFAAAVNPLIMVRCWDVTTWSGSLLEPGDLPGLLWPHAVKAALRWPGPDKCSIGQYLWWRLRGIAVRLGQRLHKSGLTRPVRGSIAVGSLDAPIGESGDSTLGDLLAEMTIEAAPVRDGITIPWDSLKPPAAEIVREYFFGHRTLEEIGHSRGISRQAVHKQFTAALRTLRCAINERAVSPSGD